MAKDIDLILNMYEVSLLLIVFVNLRIALFINEYFSIKLVVLVIIRWFLLVQLIQHTLDLRIPLNLFNI